MEVLARAAFFSSKTLLQRTELPIAFKQIEKEHKLRRRLFNYACAVYPLREKVKCCKREKDYDERVLHNYSCLEFLVHLWD